MSDAFLEIKDLKAHFPVERGIIFRREIGTVKAVDGVSLTLRAAKCSGSSANPAAANPRSAGRSCN